jgi:hypothetical protein
MKKSTLMRVSPEFKELCNEMNKMFNEKGIDVSLRDISEMVAKRIKSRRQLRGRRDGTITGRL